MMNVWMVRMELVLFDNINDNAIAVRGCVAWEKLRKLLPVLITRRLSVRIHGKIYEACVSLGYA